MSLVPSKRIDRIFPIVPPLCLLLAAQIARCVPCRPSMSFAFGSTGHTPVATENEATRGRIYRWSAVALLLSILFTSGYTISKVVSGYRGHRDALVIFGRDVRHEAEMHHWRYEVLSANDEGLLLYLRKTHFIKRRRAIVEWNRGNLDALVAPTERAPALMRKLRDAAVSQLKSKEKKNKPGVGYVLITH